MTDHQRHNGEAVEICRHCAVVTALSSRNRNAKGIRTGGHDRRGAGVVKRQPEVMWIKPPPAEMELEQPAMLLMGARTAAGSSSFLAVTVTGGWGL